MSDLSALTPGTWVVDPGHSEVAFTARHMMITKVRGRFTQFSGSITVAADPLLSRVEASVDAASVTTDDEGRDGHLRTGDFFDVATHPTWSLVSTGIESSGSGYTLHTDLTLRGVTKPVDFALDFHGVVVDAFGNTRAGFSAETVINRKDFGVEWNAVLEAGGVAVGEKVTIGLEISAVRS